MAAYLDDLRAVMKSHGLAAYIVPTEDAHMAAEQLSSEWELMKDRLPDTVSVELWLAQNLQAGDLVGVDPLLISQQTCDRYSKALEARGVRLCAAAENLVDVVWGENRPGLPTSRIMVHPTKFAGKSVEAKLRCCREFLDQLKASALVVSALDELAWLYNIRGCDIPFNPVFFGYGLVTKESAFLYVDTAKITDEAVASHLRESGVTTLPYSRIFDDLKRLSDKGGEVVALDPSTASMALAQALDAASRLVVKSPIPMAKSIKNETELKGMRECHLRDGAALVSWFAWLEASLSKGEAHTECTVADKLEEFRSKRADFVGLSFPTISGSGSNGAIIHYGPHPDTAAPVTPEHMFLCDSGAQYRDGTTDVTRTVHFGTPTSHEKRCFTRVLQGHIALACAVFPDGVTGFQLDILARLPLFSDGLDYRHGTGHGVGSFLNVHEGPQGISFRIGSHSTKLVPGMTVTNEPGYYEDGAFGIRIESVMVVVSAATPHKFGGKDFYEFETITIHPIQTKLIDCSIMSDRDIEWVNRYNAKCCRLLSPLVDEHARAYLEKETRPIAKD